MTLNAESQHAMEDVQGSKNFYDYKRDSAHKDDQAAGKWNLGKTAIEDVNDLFMLDPFDKGNLPRLMDENLTENTDLRQINEMDIADPRPYEHEGQESYQLFFPPASSPTSASSTRHVLPISLSGLSPQSKDSLMSDLLKEDIVMPRITQGASRRNDVEKNDEGEGNADIQPIDLIVDSISSSSATTPSLVGSSHRLIQSDSSPTLSLPASQIVHQKSPPRTPRTPTPGLQTKFYIAVPPLPPGITKDDYSSKPIRVRHSSHQSHTSNFANHLLTGETGRAKRIRQDHEYARASTSLAPKSPRRSTAVASQQSGLASASDQNFQTNPDLVNYYEEYVCPPPLLELDPDTLLSPSVSITAIILSTRHLQRLISGAPSSRSFVAHKVDDSYDHNIPGPCTNYSGNDSMLSGSSTRHLSHETVASKIDEHTYSVVDAQLLEEDRLHQDILSTNSMHAKLHDPSLSPIERDYEQYVPSIDDAVYGDGTIDQPWISSTSTFDESSYAGDGAIDPSLLYGTQGSTSPTPLRRISSSRHTWSVERESPGRLSRTTSVQRVSRMPKELDSGSDSEQDFTSSDEDDDMDRPYYQNLDRATNTLGSSSGKGGKQATKPSNSTLELIRRARTPGNSTKRHTSNVTGHSRRVFPTGDTKLEYCHQCRNATVFEKMTCSRMLDVGVPCRKRYCVGCILKRYPGIEFHPYATMFVCPSCMNTCNCTACCAKRKEPYISTRHVKVDKATLELVGSGLGPRTLPSASAEFVRLSKEKHGSAPKSIPENLLNLDDVRTEKQLAVREAQFQSGRKETADSHQTSNLIENYGGASGAYWGTIFSVTGERVGIGFVGQSGTEIVLKAQPSVRRKKKRVYVGQLQECWGLDHSGELEPVETHPSTKGNGLARDNHDRKEYIGDHSVLDRYRDRSSSRPVPPTQPCLKSSNIYAQAFDPAEFSEADAEGEDDDELERSHWLIFDSSSPIRPSVQLQNMSQEQMQIALQRAIEAMHDL